MILSACGGSESKTPQTSNSEPIVDEVQTQEVEQEQAPAIETIDQEQVIDEEPLAAEEISSEPEQKKSIKQLILEKKLAEKQATSQNETLSSETKATSSASTQKAPKETTPNTSTQAAPPQAESTPEKQQESTSPSTLSPEEQDAIDDAAEPSQEIELLSAPKEENVAIAPNTANPSIPISPTEKIEEEKENVEIISNTPTAEEPVKKNPEPRKTPKTSSAKAEILKNSKTSSATSPIPKTPEPESSNISSIWEETTQNPEPLEEEETETSNSIADRFEAIDVSDEESQVANEVPNPSEEETWQEAIEGEVSSNQEPEIIHTIEKIEPSTNFLEIARFRLNSLLSIESIEIQMISDQDFDFDGRMLFVVDSSGDIIAQSSDHTKVWGNLYVMNFQDISLTPGMIRFMVGGIDINNGTTIETTLTSISLADDTSSQNLIDWNVFSNKRFITE